MNKKEASARIKINKLLEESGWRFETDKNGSVNIQLEPGIKYSELVAEIYHTIHYYNTNRIHTSLSMSPREFVQREGSLYNYIIE